MEPISFQTVFDYSGDSLKSEINSNSILVLYINPIEYHGAHLPLTTDFLISQGITNLFPENFQKNFIHWPPIHLGVGPTRGPGSCATSYLELKRTLLALGKTIRRLKIKKVLIMTFHGAPLHIIAIQEFIHFLRENKIKALNPFILMLQKLTYYDSDQFPKISQFIPLEDGPEKQEIIKNIKFDFHGGMIEAGLIQYFHPELIQVPLKKVASIPSLKLSSRLKWLEKVVGKFNRHLADEIELINFVLAWEKMNPFPGYTGHPCLANDQLSEYFLKEILIPSYLEEMDREFYGEGSDLKPVMNYMKYLTLEGRLFY